MTGRKTYLKKSPSYAIEVPAYFAKAACKTNSPEAFYSYQPGEDVGQYNKRFNLARRICATCPISTECSKYALTLPLETQFGIWAGRDMHIRKHLPAAKARHAAADPLGGKHVPHRMNL